MIKLHLLGCTEPQLQLGGKQGEAHPWDAYDGSHAEDNEWCSPCMHTFN